MFIHSGENPFRCEQWNYSSAQASSLKEHMLTHSGEKPFACIECTNTFKNARNLKQHMLLHSGEKPFQCKQCYYSFTQGQHLKEHTFRHTGVKPYACQHCSFSCSHQKGFFLKPGFIEEMLIRGESKNRQKDHRYMLESGGSPSQLIPHWNRL